MEHDNDKRIREKMTRLDAVPITWDKELVWSSIRFHGTRPARHIFMYYAAASIIIAAAIVFYAMTQTHRGELLVRIGELDLKLEQLRTMDHGASMEQIVSEVVCPPANQSEARPLIARRPSLRHSHVAANPVPAVAPVEVLPETTLPEPVEEKAAVATAELPLQSVEETSPSGPPVILGKSITSASNRTALRRGRFQLRLFRGDDEVSTASPSPPVTSLASINNE